MAAPITQVLKIVAEDRASATIQKVKAESKGLGEAFGLSEDGASKLSNKLAKLSTDSPIGVLGGLASGAGALGAAFAGVTVVVGGLAAALAALGAGFVRFGVPAIQAATNMERLEKGTSGAHGGTIRLIDEVKALGTEIEVSFGMFLLETLPIEAALTRARDTISSIKTTIESPKFVEFFKSLDIGGRIKRNLPFRELGALYDIADMVNPTEPGPIVHPTADASAEFKRIEEEAAQALALQKVRTEKMIGELVAGVRSGSVDTASAVSRALVAETALFADAVGQEAQKAQAIDAIRQKFFEADKARRDQERAEKMAALDAEVEAEREAAARKEALALDAIRRQGLALEAAEMRENEKNREREALASQIKEQDARDKATATAAASARETAAREEKQATDAALQTQEKMAQAFQQATAGVASLIGLLRQEEVSLSQVLQQIFSIVASIVSAIPVYGGIAGALVGGVGNFVGAFNDGGVVGAARGYVVPGPNTGDVHRIAVGGGETIIPAGGTHPSFIQQVAAAALNAGGGGGGGTVVFQQQALVPASTTQVKRSMDDVVIPALSSLGRHNKARVSGSRVRGYVRGRRL